MVTCVTVLGIWVLTACDQPFNSPYPAGEVGAAIYYTSFSEPPKHLDPAKAYSSDEYTFMAQVYEPPFDYHYLKRPYELVPLTARRVPQPRYFDKAGNVLPDDAAASQIHRAVYTVQIAEGILYQNHPCFARRADGAGRYVPVDAADLAGVEELTDLRHTGTRRLVAGDYVTQICRLADPRLASPIYSTMKNYIVGLEAYREALEARIGSIRAGRRDRGGLTYDRHRDERDDPIVVDYRSIPLQGAKVLDEQTFVLTLKKKYPQMLYWLAMPFFAPVPQEAIDFYGQGPILDRGLTLDRCPVGTGPYRFQKYQPNLELILVKNENYRDVRYPSEGEPADRQRGLLADAGKPLPFIEQISFKLEKESLPRWIKFLQGYYDQSGISEDSFDRAIQFDPAGGPGLTPQMQAQGITLTTSAQNTTFYLAFNMLDTVVGGYTPDKQKLRQAISIAIDNQEWIDIFANGRGIEPHGPIPLGIFGARDGANAHNRFIYDRDASSGTLVRKSLDQARELLAEAGYPGGRDSSGQPLTIHFDTSWEGSEQRTRLRWLQKQVEQLGVQLQLRATDYSTFRDKVLNGNFQMLFWGWHADYPDPENFLFLLYGPNGKKVSGGENASNYNNPRANRLFEQMESMANGPRRQAIIDRMVELIRQDAPWVFMSHPVSFGLAHDWVGNRKENLQTYNTMKFVRIDAARRQRLRRQWNRPVYGPVLLILALLVAAAVPAVRAVRKDPVRQP